MRGCDTDHKASAELLSVHLASNPLAQLAIAPGSPFTYWGLPSGTAFAFVAGIPQDVLLRPLHAVKFPRIPEATDSAVCASYRFRNPIGNALMEA